MPSDSTHSKCPQRFMRRTRIQELEKAYSTHLKRFIPLLRSFSYFSQFKITRKWAAADIREKQLVAATKLYWKIRYFFCTG